MNSCLFDPSGPKASKGLVRNVVASVGTLLVFVVLGTPRAAAADCENLAGLKLTDTTITLGQSVAAGTFTPPPGWVDPSNTFPFKNMPAFCRVTGVIKPSSDSDIQFEVWLPLADWNGKFQGIGNGGFAGSVQYVGLASALAHGYATASTDTGHSAGGVDARWALGHPEKIVDLAIAPSTRLR
jgi:feruloyl esterase